jgi:hypothetical protein
MARTKRTRPTKRSEFSEIDRDAFRRAIEIVRANADEARREQIDDKLATEEWEEVGEFAAYAAQCASLKLKPWQSPPIWIRDLEGALKLPPDDHRGERNAAELLKRLLDSGLSRYEPDPLRALARTEQRPS